MMDWDWMTGDPLFLAGVSFVAGGLFTLGLLEEVLSLFLIGVAGAVWTMHRASQWKRTP